MDMDIGLEHIFDKNRTIDKIWTKIGHFFVQGLSNVKNREKFLDTFWTNI